ncbi:MAG: GGDEF domain-containing protein [Deferribacteraceae bacterium]|jgi:diguanylate cyclase (GGDEF)-like protein|nr:GGDEF domain-containing protein [Deferribacteraceae bacterium]
MEQLEYFKKLAESSIAKILSLDAQTMAMHSELEQKRRGFSLMAELAVAMNQDDTDYEDVFCFVSRRINAALNMQRTVVLVPEASTETANINHFGLVLTMQGYSSEEDDALAVARIQLAPELLAGPVLVTGADSKSRLAAFRKALHLPYFISAPVLLNNEPVALLVIGRIQEQPRFAPRLGHSDVETVQTVCTYMAAVLTGNRLQEAEKLASHDSLTKLPNLRRSQEMLTHTLTLAKRNDSHVALMFLDLDGFKEINDQHGHAAGDKVLQMIAERLKASVRDTDLVGRIGGDEFIVILSHIKEPTDAGIVASKINETIRQTIDIGGVCCNVSASIGVAVSPTNGEDWTELTKAADAAMYKVKECGKNSFLFAD